MVIRLEIALKDMHSVGKMEGVSGLFFQVTGFITSQGSA